MNIKLFLERYIQVIHRLIPEYYKPDCCINVARLNRIILPKFRFKVQTLVVQVEIFNQKFVDKRRPPKDAAEVKEWADEGCWKIVLGYRDQPLKPDRWPGHLVSIINN